jgi:4-hydroxyphenylacetate 3-monooxygenase
VFITIQKETDAGIYVSGAKVVATSSALTHYNFLGQNAAVPTHDTDLAVMFIAPMNTPGVKLFCRTSYEMTSAVMGTPFDYPLSSRLDENDAILVMDNVLVPWENVFVYRDVGLVRAQFFETPAHVLGNNQAQIRLTTKMKFVLGVARKIAATAQEQLSTASQIAATTSEIGATSQEIR